MLSTRSKHDLYCCEGIYEDNKSQIKLNLFSYNNASQLNIVYSEFNIRCFEISDQVITYLYLASSFDTGIHS